MVSLILGGAQLVSNYGSNFSASTNKSAPHELLGSAVLNGITSVDFAESYSPLLAESLKIPVEISAIDYKFATRTILNFKDDSHFLFIISEILEKIRISRFRYIYLHDEELFSDVYGMHQKNTIVRRLSLLVERNLAVSLGVSIYDFDLIEKIIKEDIFSVVQIPFNIMDQRLLRMRMKFEMTNIKFIYRSIFLQGLLLTPSNKKNNIIERNRSVFEAWWEFLADCNITALEGAIGFINANIRDDEAVIIGVQTKRELEEIVKVFSDYRRFAHWPDFEPSQDLIDPRRWKL